MPIVDRLFAKMGRLRLELPPAEESVLLPDVITAYSRVKDIADQLQGMVGEPLGHTNAVNVNMQP